MSLAAPDPQSDDFKSELRRQALDRRRDVAATTRAALSARLAAVGLEWARRWRPRVVAAFSPIRDEPDAGPLLAALQAHGFATALPVVAGRSAPLAFRLWRAGEPLAARRVGRARARRGGRRWSNPTCCSCRSPPSIGAAIASATAPAITTGR